MHRVPPVHRRPLSFPVEIALTRVGILTTVALGVLLAWSLARWMAAYPGLPGPRLLVGQAVFVLGGAVLTYGALVHLVARLGYLQRARAFRPPTRDELLRLHDEPPQRVTVLVPSYREDPALVRMTLVSAALQAVPEQRVVLLVDDPPDPPTTQDRELLEAARGLPGEVQRALDEPARWFADRARRMRLGGDLTLRPAAAARDVAALHDEAARWMQQVSRELVAHDHVEEFFRREVVERLATQHWAVADELRWRARQDPPGHARLERELAHLVARFTVEMAHFERKAVANLSHEPNKAMNLNSHLQLMGRTFRVEPGPDGVRLEPDAEHGTFRVPDADVVVTLDADSILLPGYAEQLLHVMTRPGNERVGLVQTPYSSFPGAPDAIERVAGATTDVMCMTHQGSSQYDAAYWVGANAMLRMDALRDIAETTVEDGVEVTRFIRDRTLVEDTESTIDLVRAGWGLVNHPARLAYSATPPDFGSLLIQRRRWANGGLLVLPRLLEVIRHQRPTPSAIPSLALRLNYLTSLATVNVAFLVLMAYSFEGVYVPAWLPLAAVPYFGLYARDLVLAGYRATDVVRVYALTLLLIPVHLGGVVKSLQQAVTGRPVAFARTPKVRDRTPVPALYVVAILLLVVHWTVATTGDLGSDRNGRAIFTALNIGLLAYAVTRFLGWRAAVADLWLRATGRPVAWGTRGPGSRGTDPRPSWRRPGRVLGVVALVPLVALAGLTAFTYLRMGNAPVDGLAGLGPTRMNVLVVGTDSRAGLSAEQRQALSLGDFEGSRADTLFVMSSQGRRAAMLAFPRDLLVERCDGSRGRINEALGAGGPSCLVDTVERLSGVPISHYVELDVTGLVGLVDAVGGVTMTLDRPIVDDKTDADLPAGTQRLSGAEALAFVRVRSIDSDLGRIGRQQEFVAALADELVGVARDADPVTALRVLDAAAGSLTVDRDMGPLDLLRFGVGASGAVASGELPAFTVPTRPIEVAGEELLTARRAPASRLYRAFADGSVLEPHRADRLERLAAG